MSAAATTTTTSTTSTSITPASPGTSSSYSSLKRKSSTDEPISPVSTEPNHDVISIGSHIDFQLADETIHVGIVLGRHLNSLSLKCTIKPKCAKFCPRYVYTIFYKAKDQYRIQDVFSTSIIGLYSASKSSSSSSSSQVCCTFDLYIGNVIVRDGIPLGTICSLGEYNYYRFGETNVNYITHESHHLGSFIAMLASGGTSKGHKIIWTDVRPSKPVTSAITLEKQWKIEEGVLVANQNGSGLSVVVGIEKIDEKSIDIKVVKIIRKEGTLVFDNYVHERSVQSEFNDADENIDDDDDYNDRMIKCVDVTDVDRNDEGDFLEQFCPVEKTSFAATCFE